MRQVITTIIFSSIFIAANAQNIMVNQVGFYPDAPKYALTDNIIETDFRIIDEKSGKTVLKGKAGETILHDGTQSIMRYLDFSKLKKEGKYHIVMGENHSHTFLISNKVWKETANALMKSYYYQRCSAELKPEHADKWVRAAGHPDTKCIVHPSAKTDKSFISAPGGWYDAGDYGKYVVNAGVTTATLLYLAEYYPNIFPDGSLNIPESGNGISDLLDEIRYELEWLSKMQDTDGGVFFKLTSKNFCKAIMPEEDKMKRFVIGKTSASALNFAAVMAIAARVYESTDKDFAEKCLVQAENAWKWANDNDITIFTNSEDIKTGEYGDKRLTDEFVWAASELYISTQKKDYKDFISNNIDKLNIWNNKNRTFTPGWANTDMLAVISLASSNKGKPFNSRCKENIFNSALKITEEIKKNAGRIPNMKYNWGSNSELANKAWILLVAARTAGEKDYINYASEIADYFLGKNPLGKSFITGMGNNRVMNPHHRISTADSIEEPVPGLLAGGPNAQMNDKNFVKYDSHLPAMAYMDVEPSYASNEVAINWNAPATVIFAILDYVLGEK